jgi:hypothetical protein
MSIEQSLNNNSKEKIATNKPVPEVVFTEVISDQDKQIKLQEKAQKEKENNEQIEKIKEDILKQFGVEDKETANKIKEGIDFVFEQRPELIKIGTKEQYYEYLNKIFPDSKFKDIVYHGTNMKLDEIKFKSLGLSSAHFIDNKEFAKLWAEDRVNFREEGSPEVYAVIVNISDDENDWHNGFINKYDNAGNVTGNEITMRRENDIHLLGSKQDIEKFKEFVFVSKSE